MQRHVCVCVCVRTTDEDIRSHTRVTCVNNTASGVLTVSQAAPVDAGEEGVAAEALGPEPLGGATQQAAQQLLTRPAGPRLLGKLQGALRHKHGAGF